MFEHMVNQLSARFNARYLEITPEEFDHWQRLATWDALKNIGYGESFCKHFEIYDATLMLMQSHTDQLEQYIRDHYVDRNSV